jgi:ubiquinone/menaquinone biosynthesis C-methylase UbiE
MHDEEIFENWRFSPEAYRNDMLKFQNWFDSADSIESVVAQGHIDLHTKIVTPNVYQVIGDIKKKNCLEIGFGGGRLLNAAASVFSKAVGIDIHNCFDVTEDFLKSQGKKNYQLFYSDQSQKIPDESIDFAYSFIVFQHFHSIDVFYSYLDLIKRVLVKGGCCNLHLAKNVWNNDDYYLKPDVEYGTTNSTLFYNKNFVKKSLKDRGFEVISEGQMTKSPWNLSLSGQFYVSFVK